MRDHLHRTAQIIPPAFLGDDFLIDAPRGDIVLLIGRTARETLIMAQIQVGFRTIIGHENLAMLIGAHRARIDIEIGIELA